MYCPDGFATSFIVDVMTEDQYNEANTMGMYQLMDSSTGWYYVLSHPNGILPDEVPTSDEFYNTVVNSFEFIQ